MHMNYFSRWSLAKCHASMQMRRRIPRRCREQFNMHAWWGRNYKKAHIAAVVLHLCRHEGGKGHLNYWPSGGLLMLVNATWLCQAFYIIIKKIIFKKCMSVYYFLIWWMHGINRLSLNTDGNNSVCTLSLTFPVLCIIKEATRATKWLSSLQLFVRKRSEGVPEVSEWTM